jgi:hypothetical protein
LARASGAGTNSLGFLEHKRFLSQIGQIQDAFSNANNGSRHCLERKTIFKRQFLKVALAKHSGSICTPSPLQIPENLVHQELQKLLLSLNDTVTYHPVERFSDRFLATSRTQVYPHFDLKGKKLLRLSFRLGCLDKQVDLHYVVFHNVVKIHLSRI